MQGADKTDGPPPPQEKPPAEKLAFGRWKCPKCGHMNAKRRTTCRKCGTPKAAGEPSK